MAALTLTAGLVCALLTRYAPGSAVDERELDLRLNEGSRAALKAELAARNDLGTALANYFSGLAHGDLGYSRSRNAPISEIIVDSVPETLREIAGGLSLSWVAGFAAALLSGRSAVARIWGVTTDSSAALLLSMPAALLAYLCFAAGAPVLVVFVLVLAPKIYRITVPVLEQARAAEYVGAARAWGLPEWKILLFYTLPAAAPQLVAFAATSVALAAGAAIPIEAICDVPGLGHLAWQAATARDLPLLVNLTMMIALATTASAAVAELVMSQNISPLSGKPVEAAA